MKTAPDGFEPPAPQKVSRTMDLAQDGVPEKGSSVPFGDFIASASPAPIGRDDPFRRLWELGYRKLLPIIPPDAEISPNSTLFKKVGLRQDGRGKTPGIRKPNGQWISFDWLKHDMVEADLARWLEMGAGVGIRTGKIDDELTLVAIDSDARDPEHAKIIFAEMERRFGPLPLRIGRDPKGLCPLLVRGSFPYSRIEFGERDENDRLIDRVEILSDDRQFVAAGTHPGTGRPYRWQRPLVPLSALPIVDPEELTAFLDALRPLLPAASAIVGKLGSKSGPVPDQKSLVGDLDRVRTAMERLPNAVDVDRDEYVRIGVALKASAGPEHEAEARDMFVDWALRWEGAGEETTSHGLAETAEADFRRFHPPFHLGAEYLFAQAMKRSGGAFTAADAYFDTGAAAREPLFPQEPTESTPAKPHFAFENFDDLAGRAISQQSRPLIKGLLDQGAMTVLYGESNSGKTFVALSLAFHIATGRPWNGMRVTEVPVVYVAAEGGQGFAKRVAALRQRYGSPAAGRFHALRSAVDLLRPDADLVPLVEAIRSLPARPGLVVLDTLSRVMAGGDENASTDMGALVRNLDALRAALGCHLMVVHHTGKDRSKGARGHSLLRAATDTEIEIADGRIVATKQRDIERNTAASFALEQVVLGVDLEGDPVTSAVVRILPADETGAAPAANESAEDAELRQRIAQAAYRALDGATSAKVGTKRRRLVDEMAAVGVRVGTSPPVVRGKIEWALATGVTIEADGQVVRIQASKSGSAATAPWTINAFRVPGEARTAAISSEGTEGDAETAKLECARNSTVFD